MDSGLKQTEFEVWLWPQSEKITTSKKWHCVTFDLFLLNCFQTYLLSLHIEKEDVLSS